MEEDKTQPSLNKSFYCYMYGLAEVNVMPLEPLHKFLFVLEVEVFSIYKQNRHQEHHLDVGVFRKNILIKFMSISTC